MEDFDIFGMKGLFFFNTPLRVLKQGIGNSVCLALAVIDSKVVTRKFLSSTDLSRAQTLYVNELLEIVMVGKYEDFMLRVL